MGHGRNHQILTIICITLYDSVRVRVWFWLGGGRTTHDIPRHWICRWDPRRTYPATLSGFKRRLFNGNNLRQRAWRRYALCRMPFQLVIKSIAMGCRVSKKWATFIFTITSATVDRFSQFFFSVKFRKDLRRKLELKLSPPLKSVAALPCET